MKASHYKLAIAGILMIGLGSAYAGFPLMPADVLAGIGMLGIIGNVESAAILDALTKATTDMRTYVDKQLDEVRKTGASHEATTAAVEKANAEITELRKLYDEAVKASQRPSNEKREGADPEVELRRSAFEKVLRYGDSDKSRSRFTADELRALAPTSDAGGSFLVPTEFESGILMAAYNQGEIRPIAQVGTTSRDKVMLSALSKPAVAWGRAGVAVSPQDLGAGSEGIEIFDLTALALIHNNTLEDADADVWGELQMAFAEALAEAEDNAFAVAPGHESPQGVMAHTGVQARYKPSGVSGALTDSTHNGIDVLIDALHSLKKTYRRNATWAFNSLTEAVIRKIKDTDGQYLWQPPVQAGTPPTLLGRPVINPEGMPDIAGGSFPIVVGDFRQYKIRDRRGMTVQRLVERYVDHRQTGFIVTKRVGGQCVMAEAFTPIKIASS